MKNYFIIKIVVLLVCFVSAKQALAVYFVCPTANDDQKCSYSNQELGLTFEVPKTCKNIIRKEDPLGQYISWVPEGDCHFSSITVLKGIPNGSDNYMTPSFQLFQTKINSKNSNSKIYANGQNILGILSQTDLFSEMMPLDYVSFTINVPNKKYRIAQINGSLQKEFAEFLQGIRYMSYDNEASALANTFSINEKQKGTQFFYSKKHKVGFTYKSDLPTNIVVKEDKNIIKIYYENDKNNYESIEVFDNPKKLDLKKFVEQKFLQKADKNVCFIDYKLFNYYESIFISYKSLNTGEHWSMGSKNCPKLARNYTNEKGFFFADNKIVPNKVYFVSRSSQAPFASDGSLDNKQQWYNSITIFEN